MQTMNKGIFYTTRAIGGREGQNLSRHIAIIGSKHDEVDFLTIEDVSKSFNIDLSVLNRDSPFSEVDRLELLDSIKRKCY
jgi:hypothetical protein